MEVKVGLVCVVIVASLLNEKKLLSVSVFGL